MEKMFHFVNASEVDGRVAGRREMRRHVMMGKNAGKTIHRPSRIAAAKHEASGCQRVGNAHALIRNAGRAERSYRAIIPIAGFRTFPSPVTLTEQYAEVISSCKPAWPTLRLHGLSLTGCSLLPRCRSAVSPESWHIKGGLQSPLAQAVDVRQAW